MFFILKPTLGCNAFCSHCFLKNNDNVHVLDYCLLADSVDFVYDFLSSTGVKNKKEAVFQLHGGEPFLLGADYWFNFWESIQKRGWTPQFKVQSNLLIFNEGIKDLLCEMKNKGVLLEVGTSFDFFTEFRQLKKEDYYKRWLINLEKYKYVLKDSRIMINVVICKENYSFCKEIIEKAYQLNANVKFNFLYGYKQPYKRLIPLYSNALFEAFKTWFNLYQQDSSFIFVNGMEFLNMVLGRSSCYCEFREGCVDEFFCIGPNGDLYTCGCSMSLRKGLLGNTIKNKINLDVYLKLKEKEIYLPDDCIECSLCANGCKFKRDKRGIYIYCNFVKDMYFKVKEFISNVKES